MSKKIFTIGDFPIFIEAENVIDAFKQLKDSVDFLAKHGPEAIYEIESEITELLMDPIEKSKLN